MLSWLQADISQMSKDFEEELKRNREAAQVRQIIAQSGSCSL